jgi:hypothetical protein
VVVGGGMADDDCRCLAPTQCKHVVRPTSDGIAGTGTAGRPSTAEAPRSSPVGQRQVRSAELAGSRQFAAPTLEATVINVL